MHRFWNRFIGPVTEEVKPRRIMEVGAEFGWNTRNILEYCRRGGARADIVDPVPQNALREVLAGFDGEHVFHQTKSLDAIALAPLPDLVLLDGDHNWRTVFEELTALFAKASKEGKKEPVILLHDCAWPYARRDMYYNPADFLEDERHPFAYRGMVPGERGLVDFGINSAFANAVQEGGPQNGVLTAVEDFIEVAEVEIDFRVLPFFNGLGILIPAARMSPSLKSLVHSFFSEQTLLAVAVDLEADCMRARVEVARLQARLAQRTDALERARRMLSERASLIDQLQGKLKALAEPARTER